MTQVFDPNDSYSSSAGVKLYNVWQENVNKFTPNGFYNWEQDNLPVYDLEDRTDLLWERAGYPTSSLPGMVLTVSADADPDSLDCNPNLFTTVSAAVEALPDVIRMPIILEIATIGQNLESLELKGVRCVYDGSLEIINRGMCQFHSASSVIDSRWNTGGNDWYVSGVSSYEASTFFDEVSAMGISTAVLSATSDPRLNTTNFTVFGPTPGLASPASPIQHNVLSVTPTTTTDLVGAVARGFKRSDYDGAYSTYDDTTSSFDVSTFSDYPSNSTILHRGVPTVETTSAVGIIYANKFKKVIIKDCDGPIYIRGLAIDGTDANAAHPQNRDVGLEIVNSDVLIENVSVARCKEAGIRIVNSKVISTRGLVCHRNYELTDSSTRNTTTKGKGLELINSELTFSALGEASGTYSFASANDAIISFQKNTVGIDATNSIIHGGVIVGDGNSFDKNLIITAGHNEIGMKLTNSTLSFDGRLDIFNNRVGVELFNSTFDFDHASIDLNQFQGIKARNSIITYNKNSVDYNPESNYEQMDCSSNGQHMLLDNTMFITPQVSSMPTKHGTYKFQDHFLVDQKAKKSTVPGIELTGGSRAELIHTVIESPNNDTDSIPFYADYGVFGACIAVKEGSELKLRGSSTQACWIAGPDSYAQQTRTANIYVDNSKAEISGPVAIYKTGVDVLADNNSIVEFSPPRSKSGSYDVSGWNLTTTTNHTSIELHATKSCLVADHGSTIKMRDLGDYHNFWDTAVTAVDVDYKTGLGDLNTSAYHKQGSIQFYPNPIDSTIVTQNSLDDFGAVTTNTFTESTWGGTTYNLGLYDYAQDPATRVINTVTRGAMCVRALNNSNIDVLNVHFPTGYDQTSSVYYNASGDCPIYIWNICDSSRIHAAITSVSGVYPSVAGYHGPSSVYSSGATAELISSGAPSSTQDTGVLSILDYFGNGQHNYNPPDYGVQSEAFGANSRSGSWDLTYKTFAPSGLDTDSVRTWGQTSWDNQGPFRLFVSVKPEVNFIVMASSVATDPLTEILADRSVEGIAKQLFSQGYALSADASAFLTASSVYHSLVYDHDENNNPPVSLTKSDTSGFFYQNRYVNDTSDQILLDESAANTFANAKNGAMGTSNRSKLCTIYQADTLTGGEARDTNSRNTGPVGLKSLNTFDLTREL
jgi:hypothetical protein